MLLKQESVGTVGVTTTGGVTMVGAVPMFTTVAGATIGVPAGIVAANCVAA